jgi:hypothetical protein
MYKDMANGTNRFIQKVEEKAKRGRAAAKRMSDSLKELADKIPPPPSPPELNWLQLFGDTGLVIRISVHYFYQQYVDQVKEDLRRKARGLADRLKVKANETLEHYRVSVKTHRSLNHSSSQDKDWDEVVMMVMQDIRNEVSWLETALKWLSFLLHPLLTLIVLCRAMLYIRSYKRKLHYDNVYITRRIQLIDYKRAREGLETILPMTQYMNPLSFKLTSFEQRKLWTGIVFLVTSASWTAAYLFADWSLYQSVVLVSRHRHDVDVSISQDCPVSLNGTSDIEADVFSPMAKYCKLQDSSEHAVAREEAKRKAVACFPTPTEPDYDVYRRIGLLLLLCLITTIAEAYTLRLRHAACDYFYPERADQRAGWLYNTALASRGSLSQFLTHKLAANMAGVQIEQIPFTQRLAATIPCLKFLYKEPESCSKCGVIGNADTEWITCDSCNVAKFCEVCQQKLGDLCPVCNEKINFLDSDVSLEEDSGGESEPESPELLAIKKKLQLMGKRFAVKGHADEEERTEVTGHPVSSGSRTAIAAASGIPEQALGSMSNNARTFMDTL